MSTSNKLDSNFTGLRYAEEATDCIGFLPGQDDPNNPGTDLEGTPSDASATAPTFFPLEPNSYGDFGPTISTIARTPIVAGRQREKGVTSDLDAAAAFQIDLTQDNLYDLMQGFFFADWRQDAADEVDTVTAVDAANDEVDGTGLDEFAEDDIVLLSGFANTSNNGAFLVGGSGTATALPLLTLSGGSPTLAAEVSAPSAAQVKRVGVQGASGDLDVDASGAFPALTSTALDFTTLGLIPGQWVYIGGDVADSAFATAANNGFARVSSVAANRLEFDKTQNTMADETGTGLTVQFFWGDVIKNESDPDDIVTRSYQFERSLSTAGYEYVKGAVANQLTLNVATADKITADLAFVATDTEATESRLSIAGISFPAKNTSVDAFNTSSDFSRIRTAQQGVASDPLFAFITDLTLTINNNVTPAKAVGNLGAIDVSIGDFVVEGNITAYFADVAAQQAVRNNENITVDFAVAKNNAGWVFDIPLLTLGEGRLNVEKDTPITIPVSVSGARDPQLDATLFANFFPYLPTAAEA